MRQKSVFFRFFHVGVASVAGFLAIAAANVASAAPGAVLESMARDAARNWLSRRLPAGRAVPSVAAMRRVTATSRDSAGNEKSVTLAWVADIDGGGSVILSANDAHAPVVAFSPRRRLGNIDPRSPLAALLARDAEQRQNAAAAAAAWASLAIAPDKASATGRRDSDTLIDDIRVEPFLVTKWDQAEVTYTNVVAGEDGEDTAKVVTRNVFNKDTPNNYVCGCVATAMAQAMYHFKWPVSPVEAFSELVVTDSAKGAWTSQRFPRDTSVADWTFDWSQMAKTPSADFSAMGSEEGGDAAIAGSVAQLAALAYACGVSVHMEYGADGSGSYVPLVAPALTERFGYAGAKAYYGNGGLSRSILARLINSNLDYGQPVVLGILGSIVGGHAIVCDGYGYVTDSTGGDSTPYYHLNMGWSGQDDVWYALPKIDSSVGEFTVVRGVVYNIFPEDEGGRPAQDDGIVSGRVVNEDGDPFPGVGVTMTLTRTVEVTNVVDGVETIESEISTETYGPVDTNARGIYALRLPAGALGSAKAEFGLSRGEDSQYVPLAQSSVVNYADGSLQESGQYGNLWGVDFTIDSEGRGGFETVGEAVNNTSLSYTSEGDVSWFGEVTESYDGRHAARSGALSDSQTSTVRTTVSASSDATISFAWKVSSEAAADHLRFFVDGVESNRISGTTEWKIVELPISAGSSVDLAWQYSKDESLSKLDDAAWVDVVRVSTGDRSDFQVWMVDTWALATDDDYLAKGSEDTDGDGISNLLEYIAGTDPTDDGDRLRITSIVKGDGTAELQWAPAGLAGRVYTVEATESLSPAAWTPVESGVSSPWTDSDADGDAKFYQVKVEMAVPDYE